jgi:hypothetical protein
VDKIVSTWVKEFNSETISLKDSENGVTQESLMLMEIFAGHADHKSVGKDVTKKLASALTKIFKDASSTGGDGESQIFFVATKNVADGSLDLAQLNSHIFSILTNSKIEPSQVGISKEQLSAFNNYFSQRAVSSVTVNKAAYSL